MTHRDERAWLGILGLRSLEAEAKAKAKEAKAKVMEVQAQEEKRAREEAKLIEANRQRVQNFRMLKHLCRKKYADSRREYWEEHYNKGRPRK